MEKKIIIETPVRYYPYVGGVEYVCKNLSENLVAKGFNVVVVCSDEGTLQKEQIINKVKVIRLRTFFKLENTNVTASLPFKLINHNFDILHTHTPTPWSSDISVLIGKLKRKKTVLTIHNDISKTGSIAKILTTIYLSTIFRITLSLTDRITVVNPYWEEYFTNTKNILNKYKYKIIAIPNGVDKSVFYKVKTKKNNSAIFISVLDKFHEYKGLKSLIMVINKYTVDNPNFKLFVIGDGEEKINYLNLVNTLHLTKNIFFVGSKSQSEINYYFSLVDFFILPSLKNEGLPLALLESLMAGKPALVSKHIGISKRISQSKAGIVIDPNNPDNICNAFNKVLMKNNLSEYSNNAVEFASKYTWEKISNRYIKLFNEITNEKK